MIPTPKLRFIERFVPAPEHGENIGKKVRILQQWWEFTFYDEVKPNQLAFGEWKDVPLEKEND